MRLEHSYRHQDLQEKDSKETGNRTYIIPLYIIRLIKRKALLKGIKKTFPVILLFMHDWLPIFKKSNSKAKEKLTSNKLSPFCQFSSYLISSDFSNTFSY